MPSSRSQHEVPSEGPLFSSRERKKMRSATVSLCDSSFITTNHDEEKNEKKRKQEKERNKRMKSSGASSTFPGLDIKRKNSLWMSQDPESGNESSVTRLST